MPDRLVSLRLELRRAREDHIDQVMSAIAASLEDLRPWMPWAQEMPTREAELDFLRRASAGFDTGHNFGYLLFEPDTDALVGGVGAWPIAEPVAEIGYWVRSDRHRRGYATEATRTLTTAVFDFLPAIDTIEIHMDCANVASAAIPAKLGFRRDPDVVERPIEAIGHTGRGWIWRVDRAAWPNRG